MKIIAERSRAAAQSGQKSCSSSSSSSEEQKKKKRRRRETTCEDDGSRDTRWANRIFSPQTPQPHNADSPNEWLFTVFNQSATGGHTHTRAHSTRMKERGREEQNLVVYLFYSWDVYGTTTNAAHRLGLEIEPTTAVPSKVRVSPLPRSHISELAAPSPWWPREKAWTGATFRVFVHESTGSRQQLQLRLRQQEDALTQV